MRPIQYIYWYFRNYISEYGEFDIYKGFVKGYSIDERQGCITIYNFKQLSDMLVKDSDERIRVHTETHINRISSWYPGHDNDYIYLHTYQFNKEIGQYGL